VGDQKPHASHVILVNMARLIQVTNVSPLASAQNVREIFSYLGDIDEIKVYPERCVLELIK